MGKGHHELIVCILDDSMTYAHVEGMAGVLTDVLDSLGIEWETHIEWEEHE